MRPTKLTISGFQGYQQPQTIDFTDLENVAITGAFGSGKTTIFDAISYALYGVTRAKLNVTDVISTHSDTADVTLEFTSGEHTYRVRRVAPRKGKAKLDFDRFNGESGQWEPCGDPDKRVTVTNEFIINTIHTTWAQFRATAFVEQDESEEAFTNATPKKRHDILSSILGLDAYARALEVERKNQRTLEAEKTELETITGNAASELENLSELTERVSALDDAHTQAQNAHKEAMSAEETAHAHVEELEAARREDEERTRAHAQGIADAERAVTDAHTRTDTAQASLTYLTTTIAERDSDIARTTTERQHEHESLTKAAEDARRNATELEARGKQLETERPRLNALETQAQQLTQNVTQGEIARSEVNAQMRKVSEAIGALTAQRDDKKTQWREFNTQLTTLKNTVANGETTGHCERCGQSTNPQVMQTIIENITHARDAVAADGKGIAADLQGQEAQMKMLNERDKDVKHALEQAQVAVNEKHREITALRTWLEQGKDIETALNRARQQEHSYREQVAIIDRGEDRHTQRVSQLHEEIERLQTKLTTAKATVAQATDEARTAQEKLERVRQEPAPVPTVSDDQYRTAQAQAATAREQVATAHEKAYTARAELSVARAELERLETLQARTSTQLERVSEIDAELVEVAGAIKALSPTGIPQMVMNSAIEGINADLAHFMQAMTGGALTAELVTSREKASGVVENKLSLQCTGSEGGVREFKTFSGGQRALVKMAMHAAMSKAMKERNGASIDVFCADEITGALGSQGDKASVVRALREVVGSMFSLMLIVTHDDDVVSALPQHIEVTRSYESSVAQVVRH